jgi:hypothetical protein
LAAVRSIRVIEGPSISLLKEIRKYPQSIVESKFGKTGVNNWNDFSIEEGRTELVLSHYLLVARKSDNQSTLSMLEYSSVSIISVEIECILVFK